MNGMQVLTLGMGDAFSALYYSSCLAVGAEGCWLLIDCPHPIRKIIREASQTAGLLLDLDQFYATVLTHLHADHASGVEGYGFYSRYILGRRALVAAHPDVSAPL